MTSKGANSSKRSAPREESKLVAELRETNARLAESLRRCRAMVAECRTKLRVPPGPDEGQED